MEDWQKQNTEALTSAEQLQYRPELEGNGVEKVISTYPMRISPHLVAQIQRADDPLGRQFIPHLDELSPSSATRDDPLDEERLSPVPNLVQRYRKRVLLLTTSSCFAYCRFCTRKRRIGHHQHRVTWGELGCALDYIGADSSINEVIISGGDPLTMSDRLLQEVLERLRSIPHVKILRLGSRAPVVMPARITLQLCKLLQRFEPLYFLTHINHPAELSVETLAACRMLVEAGITLVNQTVLLRGVNDDAVILQELFERMLQARIRPYYLHQMDLTSGTEHFRTRLEDGIELMGGLRRELSGLAIPHYVVDLPGGHGKIPLVPEYVEALGPCARLRAADGTVVDYPNV
ncbi:MAG: KamA family radical SAM protein [Desulfuromonas sp.]|nr:KamA family radical SAM protein [Desulfuromonas sp.]